MFINFVSPGLPKAAVAREYWVPRLSEKLKPIGECIVESCGAYIKNQNRHKRKQKQIDFLEHP